MEDYFKKLDEYMTKLKAEKPLGMTDLTKSEPYYDFMTDEQRAKLPNPAKNEIDNFIEQAKQLLLDNPQHPNFQQIQDELEIYAAVRANLNSSVFEEHKRTPRWWTSRGWIGGEYLVPSQEKLIKSIARITPTINSLTAQISCIERLVEYTGLENPIEVARRKFMDSLNKDIDNPPIDFS